MAISWNQEADFEEGDLTDIDQVVDPDGVMSAHADAALNGSYGMKCSPNGASSTSNFYARMSGPSSETECTVEFEFDPNSLTMGDGELFNFVQMRSLANQSQGALDFRITGGQYQLRLLCREDSGTSRNAGFVNVNDAPMTVRYTWKASTGAGNDDGFSHLYIDDVLQLSLPGVDNDTKTVDNIRVGIVTGFDAGTIGDFYIDDYRWYAGIIPFEVPVLALTATPPIPTTVHKPSPGALALTATLPVPTATVKFVKRLHARYRDTRFTAAQRDLSLTARNRDTRLTTERKK